MTKLEVESTPRKLALKTIKKLLDTCSDCKDYESKESVHASMLIAGYHECGIEKMFRFQAGLFGWKDVLGKMKELEVAMQGQTEPLIFATLELKPKEIAGFRRIFAEILFRET